MNLVTVVAPDYSLLPVDLVSVKAHLRVDGDDENEKIDVIRKAAIRHVEKLCNRPLQSGTFRAEYERWSQELQLPLAPVTSVSSVKYRDSAETEYTVSSAVYLADVAAEPARVVLRYGESWPSATLSPLRPVQVAFVAGYASCPAELIQAVLLLCGHWYEHGDAVVIGDTSSATSVPLQRGVDALIAPYRLDPWAAAYEQ